MFKRYSRLQSVSLPINLSEKKDQLKSLLVTRRSYRNYSGKAVSLQKLSHLLYYSAGIVRYEGEKAKEPHMPYPCTNKTSALEVYLWVRFGKDIPKGLYHYNPETHELDVLLHPVLPQDMTKIWLRQRWVRKATILVFITAVYHRVTDVYGPEGFPFLFLEAGHLAQNIYLLCPTLGLGCSAVGNLKRDAVIQFLDIDPNNEYPVYYLTVESL